MTELKILYTSRNDATNITYLYDIAGKILLPVESNNSMESTNLSCVLKSLLQILHVTKASVEIYKHQDDIFYCYLNINVKKHVYKINCDTELFSYLAEKCNLPVYAAQKIVQSQGIRISEELLASSLQP